MFTRGVQLRSSQSDPTSESASESASEPTDHDDSTVVAPPSRRRRMGRGRALLLLILLVVVLLGALALLAVPLLHARSSAKAAEADLSDAHAALTAHKIAAARTSIKSAQTEIASAQSDANGFASDVWIHVPLLGSAVGDARHLVDALDEATQVGELGTQAYAGAIGPQSKLVTGSSVDMPALQKLSATVESIGPHLEAAQADVAAIQGNAPFLGAKITSLRDQASTQLDSAQSSYDTYQPLLKQLPMVLGADGPRQYLIALMNPSEQRFSGGATLTMSMLHFSDGHISFGKSYSVAEIDAQQPFLRWPPVPGNVFLSTNERRLTAATYSPWWQVSGEELSRAWQAQTGRRVNGVFAIDLQALAELFRLTGPVQVAGYGELNADNLVSTLAGSYSQFQDPTARHQLNLAVIPAFREKFLTGGKFVEKGQLLLNEAKARHVALYFRHRGAQHAFSRIGFSGNLSTTGQDYIGVFSQNLNGSKTDYYQKREITSQVDLRADGSAKDRLQVKLTNAAPPWSQPTPDPKTGYTTSWLGTLYGIFLPRHSQLGPVVADGASVTPTLHVPKVLHVKNRKYFLHKALLDSGQSSTVSASYVVPHAALVNPDGTMTYRLDVDPQDLVVPEVLHVTVRFPAGWSATSLPPGWKATSGGATFDGPVTTALSFEIPLSK